MTLLLVVTYFIASETKNERKIDKSGYTQLKNTVQQRKHQQGSDKIFTSHVSDNFISTVCKEFL